MIVEMKYLDLKEEGIESFDLKLNTITLDIGDNVL